ncbi:alpha/beta hydrolase [Pseudoduganella sp. LjRoot289]|uniref:alpha/beta fold hydrolase n=1 Tax=Pseudoduganella sp. LjRoot289 TaxID=3342314 RepID=UPI003ECC4687
MSKFTRHAAVATAFAATATMSLLTGAHAAPPAGQDAFASGQVKVDVGDRKLNLYCTGKGSPTVLFEADAGRAGWDWSSVQPEVAKRTRACVYDRAGLGFSDPATRPATAGNASKDLHFLLKNARMDGPFVLVGAGFGAMVAQQFASRARGNVTGLVLVEPPQDEALAAAPVDAAALQAALACLDAAGDGKAAAAPSCAYAGGGETGAKLAAAQAAQAAKPAYWRSRASEIDNLGASASQLRAARKTFGDVPLAVLARGLPAGAAAVQAQQLAALSTRSSSRALADAGQPVLFARPEAVLAAIMEVLDKQQP